MHPPAMSWSARIQFAKRVGVLSPLNTLLLVSTLLHGAVASALLCIPTRLPAELRSLVEDGGIVYVVTLFAGSSCLALSFLSALTLIGPKPAPVANVFSLAAFHAMSAGILLLPKARDTLHPPLVGFPLCAGLAVLLFSCIAKGAMGQPFPQPFHNHRVLNRFCSFSEANPTCFSRGIEMVGATWSKTNVPSDVTVVDRIETSEICDDACFCQAIREAYALKKVYPDASCKIVLGTYCKSVVLDKHVK